MNLINNILVSDEVMTTYFACDIGRCKGACCVAGEAGAPLLDEEIGLLEDYLDDIIPYMTARGVATIRQTGVFCYDAEGGYVTPLNEGKECAFAFFTGGIARCAIEKASEHGIVPIPKPISCHLYPVRATFNGSFYRLNLHKWSICAKGYVRGRKDGLLLYRFLKQALIRKFGAGWYETL
ncbi:MAG TPA: DUF3109 family protein, partial [Bacteroidales bacterium]|nr:DUF3109 family protein [Bacteroidales bacterium]